MSSIFIMAWLGKSWQGSRKQEKYNNAGCLNQASLNMDQPSTSTFPSLYVRYALCIDAIKVTNQMCIKEKMKENYSFTNSKEYI